MNKSYLLLTLYGVLLSFSFSSAQNVISDKKYWPKHIPLEKASLTIYQPEVESFNGNSLEVRCAFNYYDGTKLPTFGAMWLKAQVHIDKSNNKVLFDKITMVDANFPDVTNAKKQNLHDLLEQVAPTWQFNSSLNDFMANLDLTILSNQGTKALKNDPPNIFYEQVYSELIYVDGEPIMENVDNSELYQYVVNTPYFILRSSSDKFYYLKAGSWWFRTQNIYDEWKSIENPPQPIISLYNRFDEHKMLNDKQLNKVNSSKPKLILSIHPAQLIQTRGEAEMEKIIGTELYTVVNTPNDLLFDNITKRYYVLFSGRWFSSTSLFRGAWEFVAPNDLPVYFKKLPINSAYSKYRISIPGTPEAMSAALDNGIPQTAVIDRKTAKILPEFDGEPVFKPITGTTLKYAVNTNISILLLENGRYYAVDEGVWFTSVSAIDNWQVATEVPKEVIQIPPSSPVYNIRYVHIYDSSDEYVYVGYTGGYTGSFLYQGCLFYGTGYQYNPWYKSKYFSRPMTFAFGVNRTQSKSNVSVSVGVGYGYGMGYPGFYAPYGYGYGFGSYQYATLNGNFEYKKGYEQKPFDPVNIYKNRGQGVIASDQVRRNNPYKVVPVEEQAPDGGWIPPTNLYSTEQGDIYKKDKEGNWFRRDDGVWVKAKSAPSF